MCPDSRQQKWILDGHIISLDTWPEVSMMCSYSSRPRGNDLSSWARTIFIIRCFFPRLPNTSFGSMERSKID